MSNRLVGFLVFCGVSSSVSGARVRPAAGNYETRADCDLDPSSRVMDLMDRVTVYYGTCGLDDLPFYGEDHAPFDEEIGTFHVTEAGKALLCKPACRDHPDLIPAAPDSSALIAECLHSKEDRQNSMILLHDAFDAARRSCPSDPVDAEVEVEVPIEAPVVPMRGSRIKQTTFEYELKNALAERGKGECDRLKKLFSVCDYKKTGNVFIQQIDDMLDELTNEKKGESMELLKGIFAKLGKDPVNDPMKFKDWALIKLDLKEAAVCALEYATKK